MKDRHNDINDDEIRIISTDDPVSRPDRKPRKRTVAVLCGIVSFVLLAAVALILFFPKVTDPEAGTPPPAAATLKAVNTNPAPAEMAPTAPSPAYTLRSDTAVNGIHLTFLTPVNATPVLEVGNAVINDSTPVLIAQAADIRGDNGEIVGAFILKGRLIGKSEAKAGFCSIINGEVTLGVADATPMFEQALVADGYFFRQYPLIAGGQVVENKPKGRSIRKALAETDGRLSVVISTERVTFHDFSQALAEAGVRNAIYLTGGATYGRYTDADGSVSVFGHCWTDIPNVNYIVWR